MKFFIKTYGCQMNVRDSQAVTALLTKHGYEPASDESGADLLIVNACSVREKAEDKALGKLGLIVAAREKSAGQIIGVMGCMVQRRGEGLFEKVPGLDFAVGTRRMSALPGIIERVMAGEGPVLDVDDEEDALHELSGHDEDGPAAFINVLFGCDRGCAYCIVPTVRGRERSRQADDIISEVESVAASGFKEVTLLGQSVMSYGKKNDVWSASVRSASRFVEPLPRLLEAVGEVEGIERVRFTSGHPSGCTEELAVAMSELGTVCEHLHLPVQSGSDRILSMMRRGYTSDDYRRAVDVLRSHVPGIAITTDVIVGFPSETVEDFEKTLAFMDEIGFDNAFIFKYSPRPGTVAADWDDDVDMGEKVRRNKVQLDEQNVRCRTINESYVGRRVDVLVQGVSERNDSRWTGRTRTNKIVVFEPGKKTASGDLVDIEIVRAMPQTLYGNLMV